MESRVVLNSLRVVKFFVRKPCLITKQIKRSSVSILVNYYTPKCSRASVRVNFLTFTNLVAESALINVRVVSWRAKNMSTYISCNKIIPKLVFIKI